MHLRVKKVVALTKKKSDVRAQPEIRFGVVLNKLKAILLCSKVTFVHFDIGNRVIVIKTHN